MSCPLRLPKTLPVMKRLLFALLLAIAGDCSSPRSPMRRPLAAPLGPAFQRLRHLQRGRPPRKSGDLDWRSPSHNRPANSTPRWRKFPHLRSGDADRTASAIATAIARLEGVRSKNIAASQAAVELEKAGSCPGAGRWAAQAMPQPHRSSLRGRAGFERDSRISMDCCVAGRADARENSRARAGQKQLELDLNKWGEWHNWAAGEMNRVTGEKCHAHEKVPSRSSKPFWACKTRSMLVVQPTAAQ